MLGLGDVIIPGAFVALSLRFDYHNSLASSRKFEKPYFYASLAGYITGLATCMAVMHTLKAAQPALLYLRYAHTNKPFP